MRIKKTQKIDIEGSQIILVQERGWKFKEAVRKL